MTEAVSSKPPVEVVKRLSQLPVMKIKAGPRDGDLWLQRLEEEYKCLIKVRNRGHSITFDPISGVSWRFLVRLAFPLIHVF